MTSRITIRRAEAGDADAIAEFNCHMAAETEGRQLPPATVARGVRRGIARGEEVTYYVADIASRPVGCLMLTREWSDWRDGWLVWIQSVYVLPDCRGQGIFRQLLEHATEQVQRDPDVVGLRLYVEAANHRAQQVYERSGFIDPHYKVLEKMF